MGPPVVGGVPPSYARPPGSLLEKRDRLLVLASWHYLADVRRRSWARRRGAACSRWSGLLPDPTCRRTSTTTGSCGGATPITTCNGFCLSPASTWPPSTAGCWCMGSTVRPSNGCSTYPATSWGPPSTLVASDRCLRDRCVRLLDRWTRRPTPPPTPTG